jgi:hypothetical protein
MDTIYKALQEHSSNSLKVFIDRDARAGTFIDWSSLYGRPIARFPELKLLVLQVRDIHQLLAGNQPKGAAWCPIPPQKLSWENASQASHHHDI